MNPRVPPFDAIRMPRKTLSARIGASQLQARAVGDADLADGGMMFADADDAFLLVCQLGKMPAHDFWAGDRRRHVAAGPPSIIHVIDMGDETRACIPGAFRSIHVHIPRAALDAVADDAGAPRIAALRTAPDWTTLDPVVEGLNRGLAHCLDGTGNPLLSDHLLHALLGHLAVAYGGLQPRRSVARGGLAPWQERRATELLAANLVKETSLADLAGQCALSVSHFSRAFKVSTGLSPQAWLQQRRVERAMALLRDADLPLAIVAARCGFADQSHFTRIFARVAGVTPGAWRRLRRTG